MDQQENDNYSHICGLKLKDKWGNWRSMIFPQKLLTFSKNRKPLLSYIEAEEITAFHQSNTLWYRIEIETFYIKHNSRLIIIRC